MTGKVVEWKPDSVPDDARWHRCFAAVDPDRYGCIALIMGDEYELLDLRDTGASLKRVAERFLQVGGPIVWVAETQYAGRSPMDPINAARRAGVQAGMLAGYTDCRVEHVLVAPATWQAAMRRRTGSKAKKRDELKAVAAAELPESIKQKDFWRRATQQERQGIADVVAIARWWRESQ